MSSDLIRKFEADVAQERARIADSLASGGAGSFDRYKESVGRYKALAESIEMLKTAAKELSNDDE